MDIYTYIILIAAIGMIVLFAYVKPAEIRTTSGRDSPPPARTAEEMLALLSPLGIRLNEGITVEDLFESFGREYVEERGLQHFVRQLASRREESDLTPLCNALLAFDTECIYQETDYETLIRQLAAMSQGDLSLERLDVKFTYHGRVEVTDPALKAKGYSSFSYEALEVEIQFESAGELYEVRIPRHMDWFEPMVMRRLTEALKATGSDRCFFALPPDGQCVLIGCLSIEHRSRLEELLGHAMIDPEDAIWDAVDQGVQYERRVGEFIQQNPDYFKSAGNGGSGENPPSS